MAQRDGWFVRVCKTETEAQQIKLWVGLGGNAGSHQDWFTWSSTDESEIDFPGGLRNVKEVWIKGEAIPEGRNVHMCVCYVDHVTQKMEFDDDEEQETSQTDKDDCAC